MTTTSGRVWCETQLFWIAVLLVLSIWTRPAPAAQPQAARIDRVLPSAARLAERVTISGIGFGGPNVRITVGGVSARVLTATGNQVTFVVPPRVALGATRITATNPGGHTGSIGFIFLEGVLLPGSPSTLAMNALFELAPVGVDSSQIENGVIMSRLDVQLAPDATVDQVNRALETVGGGIVSMTRRTLLITIAVPRQFTVGALQQLIAILNTAPGIRLAFLGRIPDTKLLPFPFPPGPSDAQMQSVDHLFNVRFPAAWNARKLLDGCTPVPVLIPDHYGPLPPDLSIELLTFLDVNGGEDSTIASPSHGHRVAAVLAGFFNENPPTGAHPFTLCLDLRPIQVGNISGAEILQRFADAFPPGKFVANFSLGFRDD